MVIGGEAKHNNFDYKKEEFLLEMDELHRMWNSWKLLHMQDHNSKWHYIQYLVSYSRLVGIL